MIECDVKTCVGCRMCEVACSSFHFEAAVSPALARIRVGKQEESGLELAVTCLSCAEKSCVEECPTEALSVGVKGEILLDAELCNACRECVEACPIGAVGFHRELPLFCDLCGGALTCVTVCPTQALSYRDDCRETLLREFLPSEGSPAGRRIRYVAARGRLLRASWQEGARIDS